ncbi:transposable element Tcb2 transposase [Trichonephila clavipes]|uniref:Transposable element Tcb2 transposase n=1 Tax=Trichonephila clavipes TaxID=2585209 RepID=A0A8X6UTM0_TRICX|nr:transposable element Tcb2 transposase [Trichonephila clavipes]
MIDFEQFKCPLLVDQRPTSGFSNFIKLIVRVYWSPGSIETKQRSSSRQTIEGCICNGLMTTEPDKLIGTKLSFQMNHASICGTMMAGFALDAMPANSAFQSALSNDIVT